MTVVTDLRQKADSRLGGLRTNRYSWWVHWQELANYFLPRRYKWLITPNQAARGSPINQHIIDETGVIAARTLAVGLQGGLTNPMTPWFKFKIRGFDDESSAVVIWLAECCKRMLHVFQESNFYNALATMYFDLVIFGTAVILIYEDYENVIHCYNPCAGEYFLDNSNKFLVGTLYREYVLTIEQTVQEFGLENCSIGVQNMFRTAGASLTREILIRHLVERNVQPSPIPKMFLYREMYWEAGSSNDEVLRIKGYHEPPFIAPRWDLVANDPYGRSPGMDALGGNKQLQQETKRKGQAIDKMVNPPLKADVQLKNQPASLLPGGITYVAGLSRERSGFEPVYTIMPPIQEMKEDIREIQERMRTIFYNYLFTSITDLQTVRTAEEIVARKEERMLMIQTIKRLDNEALAPAINRTWNIMLRGGLFPPAPQAVVGRPIEIKYTSAFAMAMMAAETTAIERSLQFGAGLIAIDESVKDNYDVDRIAHIYNDDVGADPRIMRLDEARDALRQSRLQQQQAANAERQAMAAVQGAQVLSQTDVGGGQNALERTLNGPGPGGGV
jgi:hypothetical protein